MILELPSLEPSNPGILEPFGKWRTKMNEAVIVSAVRTPLGSFNGSLAGIGATDLGAIVIEEAVKRAGIEKSEVNEVIMGQVLPCGYGQNPAKQAAVKAGMPWEAECITVNKVCGSALKTVMLAAQAIQTGDADVVVAGGMENMSMAPYYLEKARFGYRMGPGQLQDSMIHDGLWDIVNDFHMGISNELCSERYHVSREDQDRYAAESYAGPWRPSTAAVSMTKSCRWKFPSARGSRKSSTRMNAPGKPATKPGQNEAGLQKRRGRHGRQCLHHQRRRRRRGGHVREKAEALGCTVMAAIGAQASYGIDMKYVLVAPIWAIPKCLKKEGIGIDDVDLFEVNEAFSGSTVSVMNELGLSAGHTNVNGGSRGPGPPHRRQRLPGAGDPAPRNDPPGQKDRTGFAVSGGRGGGGHGCQTLMLIPKRHLAAQRRSHDF
jgi:acetyl-CoA C-acetyltransferase